MKSDPTFPQRLNKEELACSDDESSSETLLNYDNDDIDDYIEVVTALLGTSAYSRAPYKLDIDLKN